MAVRVLRRCCNRFTPDASPFSPISNPFVRDPPRPGSRAEKGRASQLSWLMVEVVTGVDVSIRFSSVGC